MEADSEKGCWNWRLRLRKDGYPQAKIGGKSYYAHKVAWEVWNGPVPQGKEVHHKCENPRCCNPWHMEVLTPAEHYRTHPQQRVARGRFGKRIDTPA